MGRGGARWRGLVVGLVVAGCTSGGGGKARDTTIEDATGTATGLATGTGTGATGSSPATGTGTGSEVPARGLRYTSGSPPTNLLMISVDTLRADAIDRLGGHGQMPFLSQLADSGFSVDDTLACAHWTFPTTACVLGGRSAVALVEQTGVFPHGGDADTPLGTYPPDVPFLPTWLAKAGFTSLLVTANSTFGPERGHTDGYDEVVVVDRHPAPQFFDAALAEVRALQAAGRLESPWFVHLHLYDPHKVYNPPAEYLTGLDGLDPIRFDLSTRGGHGAAALAILRDLLPPDEEALVLRHLTVRYEGEQAFVDAELAKRWPELRDLGLLDDALVSIWTDHGEQLVEHEILGHGKSMYPQETRMMQLYWADDLVPGSTDLPSSGIDIAPTVLEALGLPQPAIIEGYPLSRLPTERTRMAVGISTTGPVAMATRWPWFIHWGMADEAGRWNHGMSVINGRRAYDLEADPGLTTPVWESDLALADLWAELTTEVRRVEDELESSGAIIRWP